MSDRYVCSAEGRGYPDVEAFLSHAVTAHGHRPDDSNCVCVCCHPEWIQAANPKERA